MKWYWKPEYQGFADGSIKTRRFYGSMAQNGIFKTCSVITEGRCIPGIAGMRAVLSREVGGILVCPYGGSLPHTAPDYPTRRPFLDERRPGAGTRRGVG